MRTLLVVTFLLVSCRTQPIGSRSNASECPVGADGSVTIEVRGLGETREEGATVSFTAPNWDSTIEQITDANGQTTVLCVPPASGYLVQISKRGYETSRLKVTAASGKTPRVRVNLRPAA
jgi:hypothetical protein